MKKWFGLFVVFSCASLTTIGCNPPAPEPAATTSSAVPKTEHEHEHMHAGTHTDHAHGHSHGDGPHGGVIADWGGGKYHVEFTVDHDQQTATIYVLGEDEKTPTPIKVDKLLLSIKQPFFQVELTPSPLPGEISGASQFVGTNEQLGVVQEFAGIISGEIEGTPYSGEFSEVGH